MMNIDVILLCAGSGRRMGAQTNKIFLPLGDRHQIVLDHTFIQFSKHSTIRFIQPVIAATDEEKWFAWQQNQCREDKEKLLPPVLGGDTRQTSVWSGLQALNALEEKTAYKKPDFLLIHDAARCLLTDEILNRCLLFAKENKACIPVLPVQDTLRQMDCKQNSKKLGNVVDRTKFQLAQTPQAFPFAKIFAAYQEALTQNKTATDDADLYQQAGNPVFTIEGSPLNFKLTTPDDLKLAQAIFLQNLQERQNETVF